MTDKEAMKLALDALERTQNEGYNLPGIAIREAITAIKEALAEHAMQEVQRLGQEIEQEPVAHCKVRPLRGDESFPKVEIDWVNHPIPGPLYTSPPQRTEQEPTTGNILMDSYKAMQSMKTAAKPQRTWVGLTDEEIEEVEDEYIVDYRIPAGSAWNFAKDIEAKLKEKNT
jgi:hypothetical protein